MVTMEGWGFSLITRKCFQSHTTEGWRFSLITRKCFQSQTTKGWGFSLCVSASSHIPLPWFVTGNTYV
jgi:hypothetical protein